MGRTFGSAVLPDERRPVAWFSPPVLIQAGRELVSSEDFQRNSDRRELFCGPLKAIDYSAAADGGPFGFDFLADTGDGGNATFTVAEGAMRPTLETADGRRFVRPDLVVLGGDLAYPGASNLEYQYRFLEVFSLAAPHDAAGRPLPAWPQVLAIPQNHDWFDSVTTFCRYFVGRGDKPADFVGAQAPQDRTYFAARLPHRWWILGMDFALKFDLDRTQFEALADLWHAGHEGPRIEPGDNLILLYPWPYWTETLSHEMQEGYPRRYQRLEHLLQAAPGGPDGGAGARIRMRLSGDLHHYCRRLAGAERERTALVTCGSAGAFMHVTHGAEVSAPVVMDKAPAADTVPPSLGQRIRVGRIDESVDPQAPATTRFEPAKAYPEPGRSRLLAALLLPFSLLNPRLRKPHGLRDVAGQLWNSNLGFAAVLGLLYGANAYVNSIAFSRSFAPDGFGPMNELPFDRHVALLWLQAMFFSPFAALINAAMIGGCIRLGWEGSWPRPVQFAVGLVHGLLHGFAVYVLYYAAVAFWHGSHGVPGQPLLAGLLTWASVTLAGALVGALIFGLYFAVLNAVFSQLTNNASGAMAVEDHKGFLRFEITRDTLTMRMLACDKVPRRWRRDAQGVHRPQQPAPWKVADEVVLRN